MLSFRKWVAGLGLCLLLTSRTQRVHAQGVAAAEALFREGRQLMREARYDRACPKLEESFRLDPSAGTALNLARCQELRGKLATAWAQYLVAKRVAATQNRPMVVEEAGHKAQELQVRLSYLTVHLEQPTAETRVFIGETQLASAAVGVKIPVDPGKQVVRVTAPGYQDFIQELDVSLAAPTELSVSVPQLMPLTGGGPIVDHPNSGGAFLTRRGWGYVLGGVGVAGLAGGGVLWWLGTDLNEEALNDCGGRTTDCPVGTNEKSVDARSLTTWGAVSGVVGLLGLGAGAYLLWTSEEGVGKVTGRSVGAQESRVRVALAGGPESATFWLIGDF